MLDWVRFPNSIEHTQTDWVRLNSICSEIELTESVVFDFVRLPNSSELNPRIEFDWVQFSNVRFTMPGIRRRSNSIPWCTSIHVILSLRTWHIMISNLQHARSEHRSQCSMWMVSKHVSVQQLLLLRLSSWLIFTVLYRRISALLWLRRVLHVFHWSVENYLCRARSHCKHKL